MRVFFIFIALLSFFILGCTRSTVGANIPAPPEVTLGTSMITSEKSLDNSTITINLEKTASKPGRVITSTAAEITLSKTSSKLPVKTSIPNTPSPFKGTPPPTPTTKIPMDVPKKIWKNIPVMPGAVTGDEAEDRYRFMLPSSVDQVRDFYNSELPKLGWKFDTQGTGENGAPIFIYTKGDSILSISVIILGEIVIVTLAPI
jgi:hypothetical protein